MENIDEIIALRKRVLVAQENVDHAIEGVFAKQDMFCEQVKQMASGYAVLGRCRQELEDALGLVNRSDDTALKRAEADFWKVYNNVFESYCEGFMDEILVSMLFVPDEDLGEAESGLTYPEGAVKMEPRHPDDQDDERVHLHNLPDLEVEVDGVPEQTVVRVTHDSNGWPIAELPKNYAPTYGVNIYSTVLKTSFKELVQLYHRDGRKTEQLIELVNWQQTGSDDDVVGWRPRNWDYFSKLQFSCSEIVNYQSSAPAGEIVRSDDVTTAEG